MTTRTTAPPPECGHSPEGYPELTCARRPRHRGPHRRNVTQPTGRTRGPWIIEWRRQ